MEQLCAYCERQLKNGEVALRINDGELICDDCIEPVEFTTYTLGGEYVADENNAEFEHIIYDEEIGCMKTYKIHVDGCDDSTVIQKELTDDELRVVKEIAFEVTEASSYACMPTIEVEEVE